MAKNIDKKNGSATTDTRPALTVLEPINKFDQLSNIYINNQPSNTLHINGPAITAQAIEVINNSPINLTSDIGDYIEISVGEALINRLMQQNGINLEEYHRAQNIASAIGIGVIEGLANRAVKCLEVDDDLNRVYIDTKIGRNVFTGIIDRDEVETNDGQDSKSRVKIEMSSTADSINCFSLERRIRNAMGDIKPLGKEPT